MGDHSADSGTPSSRATDLIADFHERREAWRRQGQNLARLRADARAAAGREAGAILASARSDIKRIIVDARRALLVLTAQLQAITDQADLQIGYTDAHAERPREDDVPESVLQARRDLQRLLDDMRPEIDELAAQVKVFDGSSDVVEVTDGAPSAPAHSHSSTDASSIAEPAHGDLAVPHAVSPSSDAHGDPGAPSHHGKQIVTAIALVCAVLAGAGAWWLSGIVSGSDDLAPPLAFIPRAPRVTPAWLNEQVPTLSASVIALPAASAADGSPAGATPTTGAGSSAENSAGSSVGSSAVSVEIAVVRAAWVQSTVDAGTATARIFRPGDTLRLAGARDISITARDAGAVMVTFNGGPRSALGPDNQVVTRRFAVDDAAAQDR